jgi:hypothetical protein
VTSDESRSSSDQSLQGTRPLNTLAFAGAGEMEPPRAEPMVPP